MIPGPHRRAQPHRARRKPPRMAYAARARLHDSRGDRRAESAQRRRPCRRVRHDHRPHLGDAVCGTPAADADRARCGRPPGLHPGRAGRREDEQPGKGVARSERRDGRRGRRHHGTGAADRAAGTAQGTPDARDAGSGRRSAPCSTTRGSASPRIATAARFTPTSRPAASPTRTPTRCTIRFSRSTAKARCRPGCASTSCTRTRRPRTRRCRRSRSG